MNRSKKYAVGRKKKLQEEKRERKDKNENSSVDCKGSKWEKTGQGRTLKISNGMKNKKAAPIRKKNEKTNDTVFKRHVMKEKIALKTATTEYRVTLQEWTQISTWQRCVVCVPKESTLPQQGSRHNTPRHQQPKVWVLFLACSAASHGPAAQTGSGRCFRISHLSPRWCQGGRRVILGRRRRVTLNRNFIRLTCYVFSFSRVIFSRINLFLPHRTGSHTDMFIFFIDK